MTPAQLGGLVDGMANLRRPAAGTADDVRALARMPIGGRVT